jgi:hypothetical protein
LVGQQGAQGTPRRFALLFREIDAEDSAQGRAQLVIGLELAAQFDSQQLGECASDGS